MNSVATKLPKVAFRIGGDLVTEGSAGTFQHVNPSTGRPQALVPLAGPDQVDLAVRAAADAFPAWRATRPSERRDILTSVGDAIADRAEELAELLALEVGIPITYGTLVTRTVREWARYYAGWADKLDDSVYNSFANHVDFTYSHLEPYGVIGILLPWNNPTSSVGMKLFAALTPGNTIVVKPSEFAPFSMDRVAAIAEEAGLPKGVMNVVHGQAETGNALVTHPLVAKVPFTGGPETGRKILAACAPHLKPAVMELGGKSANIVFDDADLDKAVYHVIWRSIVLNAGQTCVMGSRVLVQAGIYDELLERLAAAAKEVATGDPMDANTVYGPVVSSMACDRILRFIRDAEHNGDGRIIAGGNRVAGEFADGFFIEPTILADVVADSEIARKEIFGPVVTVHRFETEEEAVALANSTDFGLGTYAFTESLTRAHRIANQLKSGGVYINGGRPAQPNTPFGGVGESGFGREGARAGVDEFVRHKTVAIGGGQG